MFIFYFLIKSAHRSGRGPQGSFRNREGFTLLELMLSILILALIFVIIIGALRLGFRSVEAGEKKVETLERLRQAITLIELQIESEIPLSYIENGEKKFYFRGGRTALDLSTNYSIWGGEKGYVVVGYWVTGETGGQRSLWAKENIVGQESRRETKILENLQDIYFEYYVRDMSQASPEEAGRWVEEWVEEESLPKAEKLEKIKFHIVLGRKDFAWIIPLRGRGGETTGVQPSKGGPSLGPRPTPTTPDRP